MGSKLGLIHPTPTCDSLLWRCSHSACPAVEDGRLLQSLCFHRDVAGCLAVSPDGRWAASGSRDTTIMLWEANPAFTRGGAWSGRGGSAGGWSWCIECVLWSRELTRCICNHKCHVLPCVPAGGKGRAALPLVPRPRHVLHGHQDEVSSRVTSDCLKTLFAQWSIAATPKVLVHS